MFEWYEERPINSSGYAAERDQLARMKGELRKRKATQRRLWVLRLLIGRSGLGWAR